MAFLKAWANDIKSYNNLKEFNINLLADEDRIVGMFSYELIILKKFGRSHLKQKFHQYICTVVIMKKKFLSNTLKIISFDIYPSAFVWID